ncbi:ABC transporter permease [Mucilaginibacter auburnensis]|uniref:Peptide/nickel transport system permease protein n=1 Tax=Mucilaginibacter auburnensis TaxID=1457233 RepID=A0A2H9VQB8_9SPHI|nr:ABC transporter permease [Mucilaginibacter auburnensis]PJJ80534.1 peptide/nickel transport system permease protein [Mucilaginibacter auburnensis]
MVELTPSQRTWKAFKQNKLAMAGLLFIILASITAVLGYLIMPDDTPSANNQAIQLSLKKPGSTFKLLLIRKEGNIDTVGFFTKMLYGQPAMYTSVPITGFKFVKDTIYVNEYIGDEDKPEIKAYNIFEVVKGIKPIYTNDRVIIGRQKLSKGEALNARFTDQIINNHITQKTFLLGSDLYGRDILSRLILGARISLSVGIMAVVISLLVGVTIGALAGYFGGWVDNVLSWLMNILWSLPALLLVLAISFALGKGLWQIYIAVGLSMWVEVARLVRGQVISLKQTEYIEAVRALGFGNTRIIIRHILPNISGPVMVMASSNFASAILLEAGLSFLGFGAQPPTPTWGGMIREHYGYIIMDAAYLSVVPGLAIMLIVYAFNLVTVALRDAFDIKSQNLRV